ncbi:unnamed protein product, partial [Prorocentrum cordatum]
MAVEPLWMYMPGSRCEPATSSAAGHAAGSPLESLATAPGLEGWRADVANADSSWLQEDLNLLREQHLAMQRAAREEIRELRQRLQEAHIQIADTSAAQLVCSAALVQPRPPPRKLLAALIREDRLRAASLALQAWREAAAARAKGSEVVPEAVVMALLRCGRVHHCLAVWRGLAVARFRHRAFEEIDGLRQLLEERSRGPEARAPQ